MKREQWIDVAFKGVLAAAFFFVLQRFILKSSLEITVFWSVALGVGAALLALSQHRRGL